MKHMAGRSSGLLSLFLFFLVTGSGPGASPPRWDVHLRVEIQGRYALDGNRCRGSGNYRCVLNARGMLERDNGDYILIQLEVPEAEAPQVAWVEDGSPGGLNHLEEVGDQVHPRLNLLYALRQDGRVSLAWAMTADFAPLAGCGRELTLSLPRGAAGGGGPREVRYARGILSGSNRMEWDEAAMLHPGGTRKEKAWRWRERRREWTHTQHVRVMLEAFPEESPAH